MTDQLHLTPPFPALVRELMREYLEDEDAPEHLDALVDCYADTWREAWSMAHRSPEVARIRAGQGHRWKRALYRCALGGCIRGSGS